MTTSCQAGSIQASSTPPQAPQRLKRLLMVGEVQTVFPDSPCFRDEDSADRGPGEFYQIDLEMAFATSGGRLYWSGCSLASWCRRFRRDACAFPAPSYRGLGIAYGADKPDLRFGLEVVDVTGRLEARPSCRCSPGRHHEGKRHPLPAGAGRGRP